MSLNPAADSKRTAGGSSSACCHTQPYPLANSATGLRNFIFIVASNLGAGLLNWRLAFYPYDDAHNLSCNSFRYCLVWWCKLFHEDHDQNRRGLKACLKFNAGSTPPEKSGGCIWTWASKIICMSRPNEASLIMCGPTNIFSLVLWHIAFLVHIQFLSQVFRTTKR